MTSNINQEIKIDCKDIILREYRLEDLDKLQELTWQPEIYTYLPGWNVERSERENWLRNYEIPENNRFLQQVAKKQKVDGLRLRLGITIKENEEFIGWCCTGPKEELPEPNREIMYGISKNHRNKGYTSQAVEGMINYLFQNTEVEYLNGIALKDNKSSNKVLQKNAFEQVGVVEIEEKIFNHYIIKKTISKCIQGSR